MNHYIYIFEYAKGNGFLFESLGYEDVDECKEAMKLVKAKGYRIPYTYIYESRSNIYCGKFNF